jgi:hypothetical protein
MGGGSVHHGHEMLNSISKKNTKKMIIVCLVGWLVGVLFE